MISLHPPQKEHANKFLNLQFIIWLPKTQYSESEIGYQLFIISYPVKLITQGKDNHRNSKQE